MSEKDETKKGSTPKPEKDQTKKAVPIVSDSAEITPQGGALISGSLTANDYTKGLTIANPPSSSLTFGRGSDLTVGGGTFSLTDSTWKLPTSGTVTISGFQTSEITELKGELAAAKAQFAASQKQITALQDQLAHNNNTEQVTALQVQVADLATTIEQAQVQLTQAQVRTEGLSAPVVMPTPEDMQIRLVPTHWLDRLEEYRSDEGLAFLFAGLFGGAILGILSNWVTNEQFLITRFSIVFMSLLVILAFVCIFWAIRIKRRASSIRQQMLRFTTAQKATSSSDTVIVNSRP